MIYLDNHATTPTDPRVGRVVMNCMLRVYGNASSSEHVFGDEADAVVRESRCEVGTLVGATARSVIFTSGATEALNLAIQGFARRKARLGARRVVVGVLPVEHVAVLEVCHRLVREGLVSVVEFAIDRLGRLDLDSFERSCRGGLDLASVMAANNEIGTIYPIREAAEIAHRNGVAFLTDATQAAGKTPIRFDDSHFDFLALSGHKMYGPKGIGALVVANRDSLDSLFAGGEQEGGLRPGTLNVPGIAGLGEACRLRGVEMAEDEAAIAHRRDRLQEFLCTHVPGIVVNGDRTNRLAGNLHVSIPVPGAAVVARLRERVALSTGSACSSGVEGPSHVLRALGLRSDLMEGAVRFGLGKFNTDEDIDLAAEMIVGAIEDVEVALNA